MNPILNGSRRIFLGMRPLGIHRYPSLRSCNPQIGRDNRRYWGGPRDCEAELYCEIIGLATQFRRAAVSSFVLTLKTNGIWDKCIGIYPIIGGNASNHSWNLKDLARFKLTFSGGTHNANGWTSSGQFAQTGIVPSTEFGQFDWHLSCYSRSAGSQTSVFTMGARDTGVSPNRYCLMSLWSTANTPQSYIRGNTTLTAGATPSSAAAFFLGTRQSDSSLVHTRNATVLQTTTTTDTGILPGFEAYLGSANDSGSSVGADNRNYAFFSLGFGLTNTQISIFYNAVQTLQTVLERAV